MSELDFNGLDGLAGDWDMAVIQYTRLAHLLYAVKNTSFGVPVRVAEPTVAGVDLYGKTRIGTKQACAIGAVERDRPETIAAGLTFGAMPELGGCLIWLLFFLLLLVFILAFLMRRRKKRMPHASTPHASTSS